MLFFYDEIVSLNTQAEIIPRLASVYVSFPTGTNGKPMPEIEGQASCGNSCHSISRWNNKGSFRRYSALVGST